MRDLPRRVPGRAAGQFRLFQQHHVGPAFVCKMIGQAAAHDTTANDDDPSVRWNHSRHPFEQMFSMDRAMPQM